MDLYRCRNILYKFPCSDTYNFLSFKKHTHVHTEITDRLCIEYNLECRNFQKAKNRLGPNFHLDDIFVEKFRIFAFPMTHENTFLN